VKLLVALLIAAAFGVLSVLMVTGPDIGPAVVFLFPGAVLAIIASGNVHDFRTWVIVLGNFAFYFGVVYIVWEIWERRTRSAAKRSR